MYRSGLILYWTIFDFLYSAVGVWYFDQVHARSWSIPLKNTTWNTAVSIWLGDEHFRRAEISSGRFWSKDNPIPGTPSEISLQACSSINFLYIIHEYILVKQRVPVKWSLLGDEKRWVYTSLSFLHSLSSYRSTNSRSRTYIKELNHCRIISIGLKGTS